MQVFENFISYRRQDSSIEVKNLYDALQLRGYSTFCDIYSLGSGEFNKDLITAIDNCTNFILVLGKHSLDRCVEDNDWLTNEIREAIQKKKNIICVFTGDINYPDSLPKDIEEIRYRNGIKFDIFYFDNFIDRLISQFFVSNISKSESDESKDFVVIQNVLAKYIGSAPIVIIPSEVTIIGKDAFKNQTKITKVVFHDEVTEIQEGAFERCISITYLTLPQKLKKLGERAFCRCYNLAFIAINESLEEIGDNCFGFCTKLKTIVLNKALQKISSTAFNNCSQMMEIHIDEDNKSFSSIAGILYDKSRSTLIRCPENYTYDEVIIKEPIKKLGPWSFSRCMKAVQISLPDSLEEIMQFAFKDSCNIASLILPDRITQFDLTSIDGWTNRQQIIMSSAFHPVIRYNIEQKMNKASGPEKAELGYQFCLIKTAFESEEEAVKMAKMLLDNRLIVSGQIKKMKSIYMWENEMCSEGEIELTCFTESGLYYEVERFIKEHHSYEVCELICLPIINISKEFGDWISEYTGKIKFEG